jgi:propionyl-CoA carboxylase alpha chain
MAAVAAAADHVLGERKRRISGQASAGAVSRERLRAVRLGDREIALDIQREAPRAGDGADRLVVHVLARKTPWLIVSSWRPGDPLWSGTLDGQAIALQLRPALDGFDLAYRGTTARVHVYTEREAAAARLMPVKAITDSGKAVRCPMPGLIIAIAVTQGQEVKAGETLAVVEAMKMENVLRAERDGIVKAIMVKPGDSVAVDAVIMEFA